MANRRLLCVDDDRDFRQFYKNLLASHGFEVTVAASGSQALKLFLSRQVDAVVTDLEMPGMNGVELASRLKKLRPGLPVLLVSGTKSLEEKPRTSTLPWRKARRTPPCWTRSRCCSPRRKLDRGASARGASLRLDRCWPALP